MYVWDTGNVSGGWDGSVGRGGDQADIAAALSARQVVAEDAQQTGILTLHTYIHTYIHTFFMVAFIHTYIYAYKSHLNTYIHTYIDR